MATEHRSPRSAISSEPFELKALGVDSAADDPYRAAQDHALEEVARERASARLAWRVACGAIALSGFLAVDHYALIAKLRGPMPSLVFDRDANGNRFLGVATDENVPTDIAVQAGVRTYLIDARSIPGIDTSLAQEQQNTVMAMTDAHAPIASVLRAYYSKDEVGKLGKSEIRSVSVDEVTPLPIHANDTVRTLMVRWTERTQTNSGYATQSYRGQITVANNAPLPGNIDAARLNPNGVYVEQFETDSPLR